MPADRPTLESFQSRGSSKSLFLSRFSRCVNPIAGDRLVCHRRPTDMARLHPVGPALPPLDLTPASRRQDHTTSPSAAASFVGAPFDCSRIIKPALHHVARPTLPRPPHPAPTFVTMANAPHRDGMAMDIDLIWLCGEAEYFCKRGWTRGSTNCLSGKSPDGTASTSYTAERRKPPLSPVNGGKRFAIPWYASSSSFSTTDMSRTRSHVC
jgi:hypothetical protein